MRALQNREKIVSVRMTPEQWERVQAVSKAEGDYSPSAYVRRVVTAHTATLFVPQPPQKPEPRPRARRRPRKTHRRRPTPHKRSKGKSKR